MKHALKLTAMLAAVLMLAACNKEKELTPDTVATTQVRDITYTVADRTTTVHLETDTEFEALLVQFCNYAQQGDSVTFYNANRGNKGVAAKDVATYSTTNREEMIRWMRQMEEAGKTVTVTYDSSTGTYNGMAYTTAPTPDNQTYGEWYYVPLEELLTGEWVMATDSSALTDPVRTTELLMSLGFTAPLSFSEAFVVPELPWQGLLKTIPEFDTNYYGRYVRMTFENGVMHVDRAEYRNTYDDNHNIIRIDTVPIPTRTDFTFEQENDCRIHFTPINPDGWWHGHSNTQAYDNRLIICSLNRDRFVVFNDTWFCTLGNERNVTLFRRVR